MGIKSVQEAAKSLAKIKGISYEMAWLAVLETIANYDKEMKSWSAARKGK